MKLIVSASVLAAMFAAIYAIPAYSELAIAALGFAQLCLLRLFE